MFKNLQKNFIYFLIIIIPFYLFFVRTDSFTSLKFSIVKALTVPLRILSFPFKEAKKILYYHRTFEEYKKAKREADVLKARLVGLEEVIRENTRLENLLNFKRNLVYSSVVASVIGRDPSYWNSSMTIDKGENDGIKIGMPVVNDLGVVGKIAELASDTSKVILLTDAQFSVAALVQGPRESGLVSGTLDGKCRMRYIDADARIRIGDKVITSKLSSSFPEGLLVGEVIRVEGRENGPVVCLIEPAVSFSQIEEVLVIVNP